MLTFVCLEKGENWVRGLVWLFILTIATGCGQQLQQLAVETVENARLSMTAAENAGAQDVAVSDILTAEEMLTGAEAAMQSGDTERAYRLALRAYLHARIATEKALAVRQEAQLQEALAALELQKQRTAEVLRNLETHRAERDALKK